MRKANMCYGHKSLILRHLFLEYNLEAIEIDDKIRQLLKHEPDSSLEKMAQMQKALKYLWQAISKRCCLNPLGKVKVIR